MNTTQITPEFSVTLNGRERTLGGCVYMGVGGSAMPPKRLAVYGGRTGWSDRVAGVAKLFTGEQLTAWAASERARAEVARKTAYTYNGGSDLHEALRGVSHISEAARLAEEAAEVAA